MLNEELHNKIDEIFPLYEDMEDIEVVQTFSRRVGAEMFAEWLVANPVFLLMLIEEIKTNDK